VENSTYDLYSVPKDSDSQNPDGNYFTQFVMNVVQLSCSLSLFLSDSLTLACHITCIYFLCMYVYSYCIYKGHIVNKLQNGAILTFMGR